MMWFNFRTTINEKFGPLTGFAQFYNFTVNPNLDVNISTLLCYSSPIFSAYEPVDCYNDILSNLDENNHLYNLILYPNPTNNSITFSTHEAYSNNNPLQIEITDNLGHKVLNNVYYTNNPTISLEQFCNGIYFVKLNQKDRAPINKKVIKY